MDKKALIDSLTFKVDGDKLTIGSKVKYSDTLEMRHSSARSLLKHAGKWAGGDLEECLETVIAARGEAEF